VAITVTQYEDPAVVLSIAGDFLLSKPVLHNVILTLLHARIENPQPGRYWVAENEGHVAGLVFQSPQTYHATLTPMPSAVVAAMVNAIAASVESLPGINGEAATTASFAGQWTERRKSAAVPFQGMRLYELTTLDATPSAEGELRWATSADRDLMREWVGAFQEEVETPADDLVQRVDGWLARRLMALWDYDGAKSLAVHTPAAGGVHRIMCVYTPPEFRKQGYAEACVYRLSESLLAEGCRCALYTDLGNPTSNSIYRRIGYRAIAEILRYAL
jgi:predicted GNAT family acetyltransferase